jgi:hypothetical protein
MAYMNVFCVLVVQQAVQVTDEIMKNILDLRFYCKPIVESLIVGIHQQKIG